MLDVKNAIAGGTVNFYCMFPLFRDKSKIAVQWWRGGEREFLNPQEHPRLSFHIESKASAILRIHKVRFEDAGFYYCRVQGEIKGNGTGEELTVSVPPDPLKILPVSSANGSLTYLCQTSEFYPDAYNLVWLKDGRRLTAGVKTYSKKNAKGLYEVSSYLKEPQPGPAGTVYICEVSHSTLKIPTRVSYTVELAGIDSSGFLAWWIYLCGAIALLLLIIALVLCCKFCCCKKPKARERKIQMRQCVRCFEPIVQNPKCKEQEAKKVNTQTPQRNTSKVEKANKTSSQRKKHHKRDKDPVLA
ncbi:natural cytotoxicity triggering receptor 3 ligand 1-like isoform X2 [Scyliorhinus canicula]|nr:natural cytotoxicity triggering receptor 3 ligand 1-like isoform X2 [Scyliorhinus canicula]XP_038662968.1 natural cytotoxicity triggering receptor 3 ligand 1-like isoform X2 [Scyliorhinus canicula]